MTKKKDINKVIGMVKGKVYSPLIIKSVIINFIGLSNFGTDIVYDRLVYTYIFIVITFGDDTFRYRFLKIV